MTISIHEASFYPAIGVAQIYHRQPCLAPYKASFVSRLSLTIKHVLLLALTNMHLSGPLAALMSCGLALYDSVASVPTTIPDSSPLDSRTDLSAKIFQPVGDPEHPPPARSANISYLSSQQNSKANSRISNLKFFTMDWPITDSSLKLTINVGPWQYDPQRILDTLTQANRTVEKRPAGRLLERKYIEKQGSNINAMYFEISPEYIYPKRLTWGDVAEVLGENGLLKFYKTERYWTSNYWTVVDSVRGEIGSGAVRKWYH